jgi:HK97 family phage portal protein
MKRTQRDELRKGLSDALKKAVKPNRNYLNEQIFKRFSNNAPIFLDDNAESYINNAYGFNADVYAVVTGILRACSSVPFVVHEVVDEKKALKYKRLKSFNRNTTNPTSLKKAMDIKEQAFIEAPDSDLYKLLDRPNPLQAFPEFLENMLGFKLITGNTYVHGVELTDKRFSELWVMPAQYTRIIADNSVEGLIKEYILELFGYQEPIPAESVMHLKYWNPNYDVNGSHLYGVSPLKSLRTVIRNSNDGHTSLSRAFKNMGSEGMVFVDDPDVDSLTQEQVSQLERDLKRRGAGPENYKSWLVTSSKMGFVPFGMSPVDLEILDSIAHSRRSICSAFGYPSQLLNDNESSTYNNMAEARKQLYLDICIPELERVYSELNRWLLPRFNKDGKTYHIDYDVSGLEALADNMKEKAEWLNIAWWLDPNEKRREMDYETKDDPTMDEVWVDFNKTPLSGMASPMLTEEQAKILKGEYNAE